MSGHSHFKTVAATKNANDAKKGKIFSKLGRVITLAVKDKGPDVTSNIQLKAAIEKAKEFNMPKENIERAIKKGTGELAGENLEEVSFEGFGPGGVSIIVDGITDNKNRTLGEVKNIFAKNNGKIAGEGAVKWMFERKGVISATTEGKSREEVEMIVIDSGADNFSWQDNSLEVHTKPEDAEKVKKSLEEKGLRVEEAILGWVAKEETTASEKEKEANQKLFEELDDNDAIQNIFSNLK